MVPVLARAAVASLVYQESLWRLIQIQTQAKSDGQNSMPMNLMFTLS